MNILFAWKESLRLFLPQNFKPFMQDVLKNIVATYMMFFYYFGLIIAICYILLHSVLPRIGNYNFFTNSWIWTYLIIFMVLILQSLFIFILIFVSRRDSIKYKVWDYSVMFWETLIALTVCTTWQFIILRMPLFFPSQFKDSVIFFIAHHPYTNLLVQCIFSFFCFWVWYIAYLIGLFFLFDTNQCVKSFYFGLRSMVLYMPFFFILYLFYFFLAYIFSYFGIIEFGEQFIYFNVSNITTATGRTETYSMRTNLTLFSNTFYLLMPAFFAFIFVLYTNTLKKDTPYLNSTRHGLKAVE